MIFVIIFLTLVVSILGVLFYFLHKRVEDMAHKLTIVYANLDNVHKNQEELLAQNLRMFHDRREENKNKK